MQVRWPVLLAALLLATAGCLTGGQPLDEAEQPDAQGGEQADANRSANETEADEGSQDGADEQPGAEEEDEDRGEGSAGEDETNETDEEGHPPWPEPDNATIRPGVRVMANGTCTSNFLFRTPDNATLMLGTAAHCLAQAPSVGTDGCSEDVDTMPPGASVEIEGASQPGRLVYSSWHAMQAADTTGDACTSNDLALIAIDPADRTEVHPAVLGLGGPTGLAGGEAIAPGDRVEWYGNTPTTPSSPATNRHEGAVLTSTNWSFQAYSALPGVPGDSGSGIMLADGQAAGVLYSVNTVYPGANSATKLAPALAFAADHGVQAELVTWPQLGSGPLD